TPSACNASTAAPWARRPTVRSWSRCITSAPPATTRWTCASTCPTGVRLWKSRWPVEQGYQQLKEELGLDHFEGRAWRGLPHHVSMTLLAYGFLLVERRRAERRRQRRRKKGAPSRC